MGLLSQLNSYHLLIQIELGADTELEKLKDDAREAMTAARYSEAAVMYSRAIFIEPDNAILWR